ncbi:putative nuclease HARBI1 [Oryza brachyantha]|uniref:putative nuclease HARBI1 n=1 Tax=Oryza brachyantha TaxID=4533 RepID=UPI0003EA9192|nr:putative nuclease HARBI1 [Oryza brachyantha]
MSRPLFLHIVDAVVAHDHYFVQKRNAAGVLGLSPLQKITAALRMLTYGVAADTQDEYLQIADSTTVESLKRFVRAIIEVFGDEYLRYPNNSDTTRLLALGEHRGFPGMLGSIDCMHWKWKNCPSAWQGMYSGKSSEPTIVLEAVASEDLWIWHAFFGMPGSHNDINVLHRSPLFARLLEGQAPQVNYTINGHNYKMGYYLADRIYPSWATFVKTISEPQGNKRKHFAQEQESARKAVERAFGVLQARFAIVRGPARFWYQETLQDIMTACIILHNMIVENERGEQDIDYNYDNEGERVTPSHTSTPDFDEFVRTHHDIRNRHTHSQLQEDLVEHLWHFYGRN